MKTCFKKNILSFLGFLFLSACSTYMGNEPKLELSTIAQKKWFVGNKQFMHQQNSGESSLHLFYDLKPDIDLINKEINFIVTSPQKGTNRLELDLVSGQHFVEGKLCKQDDLTKKFNKELFIPAYTTGLVPRIINESGHFQKIIVFGGKDLYSKDFYHNYFRVKVVGAIVRKECLKGNCQKTKLWSDNMVLVAVRWEDTVFGDVSDLAGLKKKVNWKRITALLENSQGHIKDEETFYPGFKVGGEFGAEQALVHLNKNSVYLVDDKLYEMRSSCHQIYDNVWKELGNDTLFEQELKALKTDKERRHYIMKTPIEQGSLFFSKFQKIFKEYGQEYLTCAKFVYPASINESFKRFWFFAHYTAIHLLYDLGYSYDCQQGRWGKKYGVKLTSGDLFLKKEFKYCNARKTDHAISSSVRMLDRLRILGHESYRFIEYDQNLKQQSNKIYSWVKFKDKVLNCKEKKKSNQVHIKNFPKDVKWKDRRLKITKNGELRKE
ncbi:MAG: hypothetical protein HON90_01945 [Halobacteriovoraceae bacterium]|jgi:hypothetical protein|nr:hypothetical protein [Halobacteriovoraceae bacterium]